MKTSAEEKKASESVNETAHSINPHSDNDLITAIYCPSKGINPTKFTPGVSQYFDQYTINYEKSLNEWFKHWEKNFKSSKLKDLRQIQYQCEKCSRICKSWTFNVPFRDVSRVCADSLDLSIADSCELTNNTNSIKTRYNEEHRIVEYSTYQEPVVRNLMVILDLQRLFTKSAMDVAQKFVIQMIDVYTQAVSNKVSWIAEKTCLNLNNINKWPLLCAVRKLRLIAAIIPYWQMTNYVIGDADMYIARNYVTCYGCGIKFPRRILYSALFRKSLDTMWGNHIAWWMQHEHFMGNMGKFVCPKCISDFHDHIIDMLNSIDNEVGSYLLFDDLKHNLWEEHNNSAFHFVLTHMPKNEESQLCLCFANTETGAWEAVKINNVIKHFGTEISVTPFDLDAKPIRQQSYTLDYRMIEPLFRFLFIMKDQKSNETNDLVSMQLNICSKLISGTQTDASLVDPNNLLPMVFSFVNNNKAMLDIFQWCKQNKYFSK